MKKTIEHVNVWFILPMVDCKQCAHMDTERHQVHPVDCNKYLPFWISWTNNVIKVGKGIDVGKQTFLTWNDTAPHAVNYVAFATGWGATGKWKVTRGILLKLCLFVYLLREAMEKYMWELIFYKKVKSFCCAMIY